MLDVFAPLLYFVNHPGSFHSTKFPKPLLSIFHFSLHNSWESYKLELYVLTHCTHH